MRVDGVSQRTIRFLPGGDVEIVDQTVLPRAFRLLRLETLAEVEHAIRSMQVRGAPLIGVTAAAGVAIAMRADSSDAALDACLRSLAATRPTAVNLPWALGEMARGLRELAPKERVAAAYALAERLAEDDVAMCRRIGEHGLVLIEKIRDAKGRRDRVNVLTHCNAGWLATVDYGTALSPIYLAHDAGIPIHVWVDETRPRNQGLLTAWELRAHGVPHTLVPDNAGGLLMRRGEVDFCITGADRVTRRGDACNKVGTYLKALAAKDCNLPFFVAFPESTIDWALADGDAIEIEERAGSEVREVRGLDGVVHLVTDDTPVANPAFDVTPARLVTSLITERGVCEPSEPGLLSLYPERSR